MRISRAELKFLLPACALPLALYVFTLAPSLLNDDPAEYQTLLPLLGVAHPTGYPLYTLLGHLFTLGVPVGDMALRVNLFSAVAGAAAIGACYLLLRALGVGRLAALTGSLALAVSAATWTYATIAQTYALNTLLMVVALGAALQAQAKRDARSLIVLALLSGLAAAHHSTFWLLLPALALFCVLDPGLRQLLFRTGAWRLWAACAAAFALPLLLYLYIPLRGEQLLAQLPGVVLAVPKAVATGLLTPHYMAGWPNVVIGSFYAGSTLGGAPVDWGQGIAAYLGGLHAQFHGFELLALGLLAPPVWRRNRAFACALVTAWVINVALVLRGVSAFGEPAGGLYTPTYLFCSIAIVLVLDTLARALATRLRQLRPMLAAAAVPVLVIVLSLLQNFQSHNLRAIEADGGLAFHAWAMGQLTRADLPAQAVVLGAWSEVTPLHYVQLVDGLRPDVSVIQAPLAAPAGQELIARALQEGRMTYIVAAQQPFQAVAYKIMPQPALRLDATFGQELTLLGWDGLGRPPAESPLILYWRAERAPAADYKVFVHLLDAAGNQLAGADHPPVSEYFPTSYWPSGLYYVDRYPLPALPSAVRAIDIGLYDTLAGTRLALPDGSTTVHITLP